MDGRGFSAWLATCKHRKQVAVEGPRPFLHPHLHVPRARCMHRHALGPAPPGLLPPPPPLCGPATATTAPGAGWGGTRAHPHTHLFSIACASSASTASGLDTSTSVMSVTVVQPEPSWSTWWGWPGWWGWGCHRAFIGAGQEEISVQMLAQAAARVCRRRFPLLLCGAGRHGQLAQQNVACQQAWVGRCACARAWRESALSCATRAAAAEG